MWLKKVLVDTLVIEKINRYQISCEATITATINLVNWILNQKQIVEQIFQ